ncbi:MAG: hypothetical protein ACTSO2_11515, partial [Promethearchaeota archaeon]
SNIYKLQRVVLNYYIDKYYPRLVDSTELDNALLDFENGFKANYPYSQMIITPFKAIARQINFDQKIEELIFNYLDSHFIDACKCFIFRNPLC